ncbi:MAG: DEAD/DEAH box helicase family protein [Prevotella sp.]|jgi:type I restriction enzyme R subunit|nr:DEAD/DEAH box helicase family protein [Prevotella sp.]MCH4099423.1 DEAD/DEAH box helicase family protein [Prevotella sp.]MCI1472778.1 DEAD/DEAH box helicase family protein [Prevotella sp.]MCI1517965.1 DEAD/DEAH box helicase family protein [Prevotella sp.]MCI1548539.1 DEAD/DEAH box helicase family protein [Prevotella sp.]
MPEKLNETYFEQHIADYLASSPLYVQRSPKDFDIEHLVDRELLVGFLKAQKDSWRRLLRIYGSEEEGVNEVIAVVNHKIDRGESYLKLLREGVVLRGVSFKLLQFKPDMHLEDETQRLYEQNRFAIVRQMKYSTTGPDKDHELDLCILINGWPLMTFELKNEATGQTVQNAMRQYEYDRDARNRMLKTCLVHFAMDNNTVMMTTRLEGEATRFLPFNKDTKNPVVKDDYATCYMWKEILQADSLLNIIQHFIKQFPTRKGQVTIFPRFHQLRVVRRIIRQVKEEGVGRNFLIQHSAGSGKTNSMAWLAHQLANLQNPDNTPVFDSVIMVTDRIVLDKNVADAIKKFETVPGTVNDIRHGSKKLALALEDGSRIIVSTVQKFGYAMDYLNQIAGHRFAVIIDEAHSAMGNEAAKDIQEVLTRKDQLEDVVDDYDPEEETPLDHVLSELQASRKQMKHISYFAFTATPKDRTFSLFGESNGKAFDYYTMKQAIEEGFILDVLQNYTTFQTMFELVKDEKVSPEEAKDKTYEKKKALRLAMQYVNDQPYVLDYKAKMMVDWFMTKTVYKIKGKAKAMVVTCSRKQAVRYKRAIDKIIQEKYNGTVKTLVAFSGTVELDGVNYTEESLNGWGIRDNAIKVKFEEPDERILIVAEKFQTGFDQPLLHTMFVDKKMGGIQCVQTLSRLNRCHPDKEDTMVIDFVNKQKEVYDAFKDYYQVTYLEGKDDPQRLYDYKNDIESYGLFTPEEVEKVATVVAGSDFKSIEALSPMMRKLTDEKVKPLERDKQTRYRRSVNRYIRQYGYLAQIMNFIDPKLEAFYIFCKLYYKFLPYNEDTLPTDLLNKIDLDKYRVQLAEEGAIKLDEEDGALKTPKGSDVLNPQEDEITLEDLLKTVNEPYAGFLDENDRLIKNIADQLKNDPEVIQMYQAGNTLDTIMAEMKKKFGQKTMAEIGKYINLTEAMKKSPTLSESIITAIVDFIAEYANKDRAPEYDEAVLKEKMLDEFSDEFAEICGPVYRGLEEVLDDFFVILGTATTRQLDGLNQSTKNALNAVYCGNLDQTYKALYFSQLSTKFEAFLRKIYYLEYGEDVPVEEGYSSGLANTSWHFKELWRLKKNRDKRFDRLSRYYEDLRGWRNEESHGAPSYTETELDENLHKTVSLYLFSVAISITELETAGKI